MRKLFTFFAALTLSVGLWAEVPANVESVDLGLPSGLKWANMNVGATSPADYGDYFAWGETKPKKNYSWSTYLLGSGSWSSLTRYTCPDGQTSCIWYDGGAFIGDNKTTLDPKDDAARVNWGADWRMPTKNEIEELIGNCKWEWTNNYNNTGVNGYIVKSNAAGNNNSIFLPASGYYEGESLEGPGTFGDYWSSSLYGYSDAAYRIYFGGSDPQGCDGVDRYNGCSVRPVIKSIVPPLPTHTITWLVNNNSVKSESQEEGVKLNTLTMPSTPADDDLSCADKFIGWSRSNLGSTLGQDAPSDLFTDISKFPDTEVVGSTDIIFYAVFASSGGAGASSSITSFATGDYLLIDTYNGKYYAMSGSGKSVTGVDISSAVTANVDGTISVDVSKSVITDAMIYTIGGTASAATVYNIEDGNYVQGGSTNDFTTEATNKWTVTNDDDRFTFVYSSSCILYRDGYNFKNYSTGSRGNPGYGTGYLYLVPPVGYEDYVTSCSKSLSINPPFLTAERPHYGTGTLTATANLYTPSGYTWTSDNEDVATVSGSGATATVTYHASGTCTITCSAPYGSTPMTATATITVPSSGFENVTYIDEQGETQTTDAWEVKSSDNRVMWGTTGQTTWYVVTGEEVTLYAGALCNGDVRLILADGAKLTTKGENTNQTPGIYVTGEGNSLTIYGQTNQSGYLYATGGNHAAGIGGANGGSGSHITINGGIVTANGGVNAAGIGGGQNGHGSYITINRGTVMAKGGDGAAGIGGGYDGNGTYITINGGIVTANNSKYGANGIGGGGGNGYGRNIVINGGTVIATGGEHDYVGIGSSKEGDDYNIFISDAYVFYAGESETLTDVDIVAHSSATDLSNNIRKRYVKVEGLATPYTRTVTKDQWGTVCLPYAATSFSGATFYKVNYYDASNPSDLKLYIEPVTTLEAGMPYIFEATADGTLTINHSATTPMAYSEASNERGLYGSFARTVITSDGNMAAISGGQVVVAGNGNTVTVPACRAYLDMTEVPTTEQPHSAPLRCIGVPRQTPTGNENVNVDGNMNGKFINNGRFVIIREGKVYNAQGIEIQ